MRHADAGACGSNELLACKHRIQMLANESGLRLCGARAQASVRQFQLAYAACAQTVATRALASTAQTAVPAQPQDGSSSDVLMSAMRTVATRALSASSALSACKHSWAVVLGEKKSGEGMRRPLSARLPNEVQGQGEMKTVAVGNSMPERTGLQEASTDNIGQEERKR
eukprot:6189327-Pleurochrysis_carterae.AAC.1